MDRDMEKSARKDKKLSFRFLTMLAISPHGGPEFLPAGQTIMNSTPQPGMGILAMMAAVGAVPVITVQASDNNCPESQGQKRAATDTVNFNHNKASTEPKKVDVDQEPQQHRQDADRKRDENQADDQSGVGKVQQQSLGEGQTLASSDNNHEGKSLPEIDGKVMPDQQQDKKDKEAAEASCNMNGSIGQQQMPTNPPANRSAVSQRSNSLVGQSHLTALGGGQAQLANHTTMQYSLNNIPFAFYNPSTGSFFPPGGIDVNPPSLFGGCGSSGGIIGAGNNGGVVCSMPSTPAPHSEIGPITCGGGSTMPATKFSFEFDNKGMPAEESRLQGVANSSNNTLCETELTASCEGGSSWAVLPPGQHDSRGHNHQQQVYTTLLAPQAHSTTAPASPRTSDMQTSSTDLRGHNVRSAEVQSSTWSLSPALTGLPGGCSSCACAGKTAPSPTFGRLMDGAGQPSAFRLASLQQLDQMILSGGEVKVTTPETAPDQHPENNRVVGGSFRDLYRDIENNF